MPYILPSVKSAALLPTRAFCSLTARRLAQPARCQAPVSCLLRRATPSPPGQGSCSTDTSSFSLNGKLGMRWPVCRTYVLSLVTPVQVIFNLPGLRGFILEGRTSLQRDVWPLRGLWLCPSLWLDRGTDWFAVSDCVWTNRSLHGPPCHQRCPTWGSYTNISLLSKIQAKRKELSINCHLH